MSRRTRSLRPEDAELWHRVARSVTPLHPVRPTFMPDEMSERPKKPASRPTPVEPFRIGGTTPMTRSHVLVPALADQLANPPVQMDKKTFDRMSRGKLLPEARIDLHGMTLGQAHPALNRFVIETHAAGRRLVLVITGKGRRGDDFGPIPQRHGILKHQVPQWLMMPPLGPLVLQVAEAHLKHGGTGAYYVYLRRQK